MTLYAPPFDVLPDGTDSPLERRYFRLGRRTKKIREILDTLIGGDVTDTAAVSESRVAHSTTELGGVRTIESRSIINRATTAADATHLQNMFSEDSKIATPADGAGVRGTNTIAWAA